MWSKADRTLLYCELDVPSPDLSDGEDRVVVAAGNLLSLVLDGLLELGLDHLAL